NERASTTSDSAIISLTVDLTDASAPFKVTHPAGRVATTTPTSRIAKSGAGTANPWMRSRKNNANMIGWATAAMMKYVVMVSPAAYPISGPTDDKSQVAAGPAEGERLFNTA